MSGCAKEEMNDWVKRKKGRREEDKEARKKKKSIKKSKNLVCRRNVLVDAGISEKS